MLASCRSALAKRGLSISSIVATLCSVSFSLYMLYLFLLGKCDMVYLLQPLMARAAKHLSAVSGVHGYWLDYGTLLGAVRDGGIIPWEFDLDMGVESADCAKFQALQQSMNADDMHVYLTGDWVPGKEDKLLGYDGFLHKACTRIYDKDHRVYIDFDWNRRFTYEEAHAEREKQLAKGGVFDLPADYTKQSGDLLCNYEAWEVGSQGQGGCRLASSIFPLKPVDVLGVKQWIVHEPDTVLTSMYGPNWRIPQPKGYKLLFCSWMPIDTIKFTIVWLFIALAPFAAWRYLPRVWAKLQQARGVQPAPHRYASLEAVVNRSP